MSDDGHSFLVVLGRDVGDEATEAIQTALYQIKGVVSVQRNVTDFTSVMAYERAKRELSDKIWDVLWPKAK